MNWCKECDCDFDECKCPLSAEAASFAEHGIAFTQQHCRVHALSYGEVHRGAGQSEAMAKIALEGYRESHDYE